MCIDTPKGEASSKCLGKRSYLSKPKFVKAASERRCLASVVACCDNTEVSKCKYRRSIKAIDKFVLYLTIK